MNRWTKLNMFSIYGCTGIANEWYAPNLFMTMYKYINVFYFGVSSTYGILLKYFFLNE